MSQPPIDRTFVEPRDRPADGNIRTHYHLESARWIWPVRHDRISPEMAEFALAFELEREVKTRIHVSADQRYELFLDGAFVSCGPDRCDPCHWSFASYDIRLAPGRHRLTAHVMWWGDRAPAAQMSVAPGFILSVEGLEELLNTGTAPWRGRLRRGIGFRPPLKHAYHAIGHGFEIDCGAFFAEDAWVDPVQVHPGSTSETGIIAPGPVLHPSPLPDQMRQWVEPVRALALGTGEAGEVWRSTPDERLAPWQRLIAGEPVEIAAHERVACLFELDDYICGYSVAVVSRGRGGHVVVEWSEALDEFPDPGERSKGDRGAWEGKYFNGFGDGFAPDGPEREVRGLWWRSGRFLRVSIETRDEPMTLHRIGVWETRYPYEITGRFAAEESGLDRLVPMMERGLQACAHETYVDCPFYEQLMYVGDTRLQVLCWYVLSGDDRLVRRSIELFDWSRLRTEFVAERYPSDPFQLSLTFSMIWVLMVRDYAWWRDDPQFVRARLPGIRALLDRLLELRNADGLLERLPGWSFVDWWDGWPHGTPPGAREGSCSILDLLLIHALRAAAELEEAFGEPEPAARWARIAEAYIPCIRTHYWDEERGLMKDDRAGSGYSEHAQCLAILGGLLNEREVERCVAAMHAAEDVARTTVYFRHYLFEVWNRLGRGDRIVEAMQLWESFLERGLKTPPEKADPTRSDCHAWSSHPLFHFRATLAGIRPDAPGFRSVRIAPSPGPLKHIATNLPHPKGEIFVALAFDGDRVHGTVTLPNGVGGTFVWRGETRTLAAGETSAIDI